MDNEDEKPRHSIQLEIPFKTYGKFFIAFVMFFLIYKLASLLILLFLSVLVGVALHSVERFLLRKGWRKSLADAFLVFTLGGNISLIIFYIIPLVFGQMKELLNHIPEYQHDLNLIAPAVLRESFGKLFSQSSDSMGHIWNHLGTLANLTISSIFEFGLMLIVAIYMLLDGHRGYAWILGFFKERTRKRIDETANEIGPIIESYIIGQATTSTLAAIWVFSVASFLDIPSALTLAVLAAVFDILPGIGFILNVLTAGLLALTVSTHAAFSMVLALAVYSAIENYILVPQIYGNRMKLSPLVVLLSIIVSGTVAGIPGMIAVLPIVAAYVPIERRWLKHQERFAEAVENHRPVPK